MQTLKSRYGFWRNLLPIYGGRQLAWYIGIGLVGGGIAMASGVDHLSFVAIGGMAGMWITGYRYRPAVITISPEESALLENALQTEGHYAKSDDGLWRLVNAKWWRTWPHDAIEIERGPSTGAVFAPMPTMKRISNFITAKRSGL